MAKNKEYDEIMQEITAGLTGDKKKDYEYLNSKMEEYKGHKYNQEILRACGRLISSLLPEEAMKRMGEELFKHDLGKQAVDQGEKEAAQFFLGILYGLTEDEEIKKMIDSMGE